MGELEHKPVLASQGSSKILGEYSVLVSSLVHRPISLVKERLRISSVIRNHGQTLGEFLNIGGD